MGVAVGPDQGGDRHPFAAHLPREIAKNGESRHDAQRRVRPRGQGGRKRDRGEPEQILSSGLHS